MKNTLRKVLFYLFVITTVLSCGTTRKTDKLYYDISYFQHVYNDSIKTRYIEGKPEKKIFFEYWRLEAIQQNRWDLLKKEGIDINIKNGYICILEDINCCYSGNYSHGNIWSKDFNIYYNGHHSLRDCTVDKDRKSSSDDWLLFKRAIEEWDLDQIKKYNDHILPHEEGNMIATRIEIKKGKVVNINCYQWSDSEYH